MLGRKKGERGEGGGQGDVPRLASDSKTRRAPVYRLCAAPRATGATCFLPSPASRHDTGAAQKNIRHPNGTGADAAFTQGRPVQQRLFPQAGTGATGERGDCSVIVTEARMTVLDAKLLLIKSHPGKAITY